MNILLRQLKLVPVILMLVIVCPAAAWQLIVTGNWHGHLASFDPFGEAVPGNPWRIPALINGLTHRNRDKTLVISVGNHTGGNTADGFLSDGICENALTGVLERESGLAAIALGPDDFFQARNTGVPPGHLSTHIWTNVSAPRGGETSFEQVRLMHVDGHSIGLANLIDEDLLVDSPLFGGGYQIEDPARALRRLRFEHPDAWDMLFVVCHMRRVAVQKLMRGLSDDIRLLWVPPPDETTDWCESIAGSHEPPLWLVPDGDKALLTIQVDHRALTDLTSRYGHSATNPDSADSSSSFAEFKNRKCPDVETRRLPLSKASNRHIPSEFSQTASEIRHKRLTALHVMSMTSSPPPLSYRFAPSLHARLARQLLRADLAITTMEPSPVVNERIIDMGLVTRVVPPRKLRVYDLAGGDLERLLTQLLRTAPNTPVGFDGGHLSYLGGAIHEISVSGRIINRETRYRIVLDEDFFLFSALEPFLRSARLLPPRGLTLWDAWAILSQ
ncbi:MAG: hypothetical protein HQM09_03495 [Candidatus Riflebacteria bacterium]|nr:hypothetical protein [Candidatus Riflebacteria bacterium]